LDAAGEYLAEVHIKNMQWNYCEQENGKFIWEASTCPVQKGLVNWPNLISLLKKRNYKGWLFFEDFSTEKPLDFRLKENLTWFRELIGTA